jgi:hypothetical protein
LRLFVIAGLAPAIHLLAEKAIDARVSQTSLRTLRKLDCAPAHGNDKARP